MLINCLGACAHLTITVSEIERYICEKIVICIRRPVRGVPVGYRHPVWYGKTKMVGLPDGEKKLRISITVYTQYRRVTDRQTDGQTNGHLATAYRPTRYAYASRSKNQGQCSSK